MSLAAPTFLQIKNIMAKSLPSPIVNFWPIKHWYVVFLCVHVQLPYIFTEIAPRTNISSINNTSWCFVSFCVLLTHCNGAVTEDPSLLSLIVTAKCPCGFFAIASCWSFIIILINNSIGCLRRLAQWLKCKIRGGGTLHSDLGPCHGHVLFPLLWGTLWAINWRWGASHYTLTTGLTYSLLERLAYALVLITICACWTNVERCLVITVNLHNHNCCCKVFSHSSLHQADISELFSLLQWFWAFFVHDSRTPRIPE